jgi:hypothetical protein
LDEEKFINVQKWFLETETTMDNMTRELGIEQEAQPFGRGNIRVGELDEEIRSGIEIQQEKPMVYCANALNSDPNILEDDLYLKSWINREFGRDPKSMSFTDMTDSRGDEFLRVNLIYTKLNDEYEVRMIFYRSEKVIFVKSIYGYEAEIRSQIKDVINEVEVRNR